jgi:Flp pilus assembly pilin Flp
MFEGVIMFNHALAYVIAVLVSDKSEEKGVTAVEYALVVGLVSIVVVGAVAAFKGKIDTFVSGVTF